jgi:hypothetical protein
VTASLRDAAKTVVGEGAVFGDGELTTLGWLGTVLVLTAEAVRPADVGGARTGIH